MATNSIKRRLEGLKALVVPIDIEKIEKQVAGMTDAQLEAWAQSLSEERLEGIICAAEKLAPPFTDTQLEGIIKGGENARG